LQIAPFEANKTRGHVRNARPDNECRNRRGLQIHTYLLHLMIGVTSCRHTARASAAPDLAAA
jgi:hypothetical protein